MGTDTLIKRYSVHLAAAALTIGAAVFGVALGSLTHLAVYTERAALRAEVWALTEGDGSCAVARDGPPVLCWLEGGVLHRAEVTPRIAAKLTKSRRR